MEKNWILVSEVPIYLFPKESGETANFGLTAFAFAKADGEVEAAL